MRIVLKRAMPFILSLLFVAIVACSIFFGLSSNDSTTLLPRNYNVDGSHAMLTQSGNSGINFAEGDPSLLKNGEVVNFVILICFSDENPTTVFSPKVIKGVDNKLNGACSMADYYRTISYGAFAVNSVFANKNTEYYVYKDTRSRSYYEKVTAESGNNRYTPESTLLNNAVASADDYFDYTGLNIDVNSDGYADCVSFVISGDYSSTSWGHLMWPHAWNLNKITKLASGGESATLNGKKVDNYTFTFANAFGMGLITHEFGHLVGLPDLYHYGDKYDDYLPVGYWDLMHLDCAIPQFSLSYIRDKYYGFLDKKQVPEMTTGGTYSLKTTTSVTQNDVVAYKITLTNTESIWLEYRKNADASYDRGLPSSGLLIYRVNNSVVGNTEGGYNRADKPDEIFIFRPDCDTENETTTRSKELYNLSHAPLTTDASGFSNLGSKTITTRYSQNCIYLTNGTNTGIIVTVTEQTDSLITFTVDLGEYDCTYIGDSYVVGQKLDGNSIEGKHYAYFGQSIDITVYLKYSNRPASIELTDYEIEYENIVCPEGQTAYVIFTDSSGERRIPFILYIYDIQNVEAKVSTRPNVTVIGVGEELDLSGLTIMVDYLSGRQEIVEYDKTAPEEWTIIEGLDTSLHGRYDHVRIRYGEKIYFTLNGVIVRSSIQSLRVTENNTLHILGNLYTPSFNVIGTFCDGSERKLENSEFTIEYASDILFEKTKVFVISKENTDLKAETFAYLVGDSTINEATIVSQPTTLDVEYGKEPSFIGGTIKVIFAISDTAIKEIILPSENYSSVLLESFNPTKVGTQNLSASIGNVAFGFTVTVLPKPKNIISVNSSSEIKDKIKLDEAKARIIITADMDLGELASALLTELNMVFTDSAGGFDMPISAYENRKVGNNLYLTLTTDSGKPALRYSVYRLGDYDDDGVITDMDENGWICALLTPEKNESYHYLDANGDGLYTLTDFVILLREKEKEL